MRFGRYVQVFLLGGFGFFIGFLKPTPTPPTPTPIATKQVRHGFWDFGFNVVYGF